MNTKYLKTYWEFLVIIVLFIIITIFSIFIYLTWNKEPPKELFETEASVKINLPVIDWAKYSSLSKQYENDTLIKNENEQITELPATSEKKDINANVENKLETNTNT